VVGAVEDVHGLFEEDFDNLVVRLRRNLGLLQAGGGRAQLTDAQHAAAIALDQAGRGRVQAFIQQFAQGLQAFRTRADFLARRQFVEHVDQGFMGAFGFMEEALADR